jgi:hypothetical protein
VQARDIAGNESGWLTITLTVTDPPNTNLLASYNETFAGANVNGLVETVGSADIYTCLYTDMSIADRWALGVTDDSTVGGPTPESGSLTGDVYDYGSTITGGADIVLSINSLIPIGSVNIACTINYSADNVTYTACTTGTAAHIASNFRYLRVDYAFSADNSATGSYNYRHLTGVTVKIQRQKFGESGSGTVVVAGSGAVITFSGAYTQIISAMVVYTGASNYIARITTVTTSAMGVAIFDTSGTLKTGSFYWIVEGI